MMKTTLRALMVTAATGLALAGCKDRDSASAGLSGIEVPGLSEAQMTKHFAVESQSFEESSAMAALASLGLAEASEGFEWSAREGANGTYTYTDVAFTDDETVGNIGTLVLTNIRQEAGETVLDKLEARDIVITGGSAPGDDGRVTIEEIVVVEPDMEDVRALLSSDGDFDSLPSARAFSLTGMELTADDEDSQGTIGIERVAFAEATSAAARDGFVMVDDIALDIMATEDGRTTPIKISLDEMSVAGLADIGLFTGDFSAIGNLRSATNPYGLPFTSVNIEDFDLSADTLVMEADSIKATYAEKGDTIIGKTRMDPVVLRFKGEPTVPDMMQLYTALSDVGYEEIVLTAGGDTVVDMKADTATAENGFFEMKDGFRLDMDYTMGGVKAMQDAQMQALADIGEAPGPDASPAEHQAHSQAIVAASMSGIENMTIDEAVIRFDDNSIVDRIFEQMAVQQGTSAKALRMQTKGMLAMGTMMAQGSGVDPEIVNDVITALGEFLDAPGSTLVIAIDPEAATPMMALGDLDKAAMGFSASVEK